jgi:hypothetical protein
MGTQTMDTCKSLSRGAFISTLTSSILSFVSISMPPLVLEIEQGNPKNGTKMCLWPRNNGPNQKWRIQGFK